MKLSVIVPAFNEAESLALLVPAIGDACAPYRPFEVLCVDDGSSDETPSVLSELSGQYPELRTVRFKYNRGKSTALAAGFERAAGEIVLTIDADLQNDPNDIAALVDALEGVDAAFGVRKQRAATLLKKAASRFANYLRRALLKDNCLDSACGFKAFKRYTLERMIMFEGAHRFFPAMLKAQGYRFVEVPVRDLPRQFGASKYRTLLRGVSGFIDMCGVGWLQRRRISYEIEEPCE